LINHQLLPKVSGMPFSPPRLLFLYGTTKQQSRQDNYTLYHKKIMGTATNVT